MFLIGFLSCFSFEIEGYVAGFGNPDWKRTHEAAKRTAVAVAMLWKQGATCVGRTVMDELGFGFVPFVGLIFFLDYLIVRYSRI
jgi:hypothetical protein